MLAPCHRRLSFAHVGQPANCYRPDQAYFSGILVKYLDTRLLSCIIGAKIRACLTNFRTPVRELRTELDLLSAISLELNDRSKIATILFSMWGKQHTAQDELPLSTRGASR
jgi:hypothetical protein